MSAESEFNLDAAAAKLYPAEPRAKSSDNQRPDAPDAAAAETMYRAQPYDVFPVGLRQMLEATDDTQARVLGRTADERLAYGQNFAALGKAGLPDQILRDLLTADLDADQADVRGLPEQDAATIQSLAEELRGDLVDVYGVEGAEKWLALTSKFVSSTPALKAILGRRGNSARKHLVLPILEHVRRQHLGM